MKIFKDPVIKEIVVIFGVIALVVGLIAALAWSAPRPLAAPNPQTELLNRSLQQSRDLEKVVERLQQEIKELKQQRRAEAP